MTQYLLIATPPDGAALHNLLNAALVDSKLPEGVEQIGNLAWLVDERKALAFYAAMLHNAPSRNVKLAVFRLEDDARLL